MKTISQIPNNSFYSFDSLKIYKNKNGKVFMAMPEQEIKATDTSIINMKVEESTKEEFINAVKKASIKTAMSHLYQEGLLKELT